MDAKDETYDEAAGEEYIAWLEAEFTLERFVEEPPDRALKELLGEAAAAPCAYIPPVTVKRQLLGWIAVLGSCAGLCIGLGLFFAYWTLLSGFINYGIRP